MNDLTDHTGTVRVDIDRVDRAAKALAGAASQPWSNPDVRNRYRGLALAAIGAYLAAPAGEQS